MSAPVDRRALVAVDLGAQSCRVSLLRWTVDGPCIQMVHRIPNAPVLRDGQMRWDLSSICAAADEGLRRCAAIAVEGISAIGVTGWAVDYVRLNAEGKAMADPFCYRDPRAAVAMDAVHQRISPERLYALTGIQVLSLNTLYQLHADSMAGISKHLRWLNLPEYMLYRWGARPVAEYTNATHTAMVASGTLQSGALQWADEIFSAIELDPSAAPEIVPSGSIVGRLQGPLSQLPALRDTALIAPACHDTASAIAGIPAQGDDWAYISSGTWSLVGTLLDKPCSGPEAARMNFTNEGGVGGKICFLRNVNGLWLLQQCIESWNAAGAEWTAETLINAAGKLSSPQELFGHLLLDVDDPDLLAPGKMSERIVAQLTQRYGRIPTELLQSPPAMTWMILHGLATRYATVLHQAESLTGKHFQSLYIVGGGSKNVLLNKLTEQATGLKIRCGSVESATLGNFAVQLAALENSGERAAGAQAIRHTAVAHWANMLAHSSMLQHENPSDPSKIAAQPAKELRP